MVPMAMQGAQVGLWAKVPESKAWLLKAASRGVVRSPLSVVGKLVRSLSCQQQIREKGKNRKGMCQLGAAMP